MKSSKMMRQTAAVRAKETNTWKGSKSKLTMTAKEKSDAETDRLRKMQLVKLRRRKMGMLSKQVEFILNNSGGDTTFFPVPDPDVDWWEQVCQVVWETFEADDLEFKTTLSTMVSRWIVFLVLVSSITAVIETLPMLRLEYASLWLSLEWFFQINFSVELFSKMVCCPDRGAFFAGIKNWIDMVVVLPFWFENIYSLFAESALPNLTFVRLLRLGKGLRLVKLGRYNKGVELVVGAILNAMDALLLFNMILVMSLIATASMIFYSEKQVWIDGVYYRDYNRGYEVKPYQREPI
jgi:hypothetical protein